MNVYARGLSSKISCSILLQILQRFSLFFSFQMVKLCNSTFCKKSVLSNALSNSNKVSHLVGKLIPGVFTKEAIMRATLTGKRPPAAGRSTAPVDQTGLHPTAVNDILCKYLNVIFCLWVHYFKQVQNNLIIKI